jgi:RinA family phage transcriptional activator
MKSVLQPRVRDFVAWQLEHYRDNKMQLEEYKRDMIPSPTAKYGGTTGHGNEAHRSTEDIVERISSSAYIRNLEQTVKAIDYVISRLDSTDLDLVKLVYFRGEYTVEGAAQIVNLSRRAAYNHINGVLVAVAMELGLVNVN